MVFFFSPVPSPGPGSGPGVGWVKAAVAAGLGWGAGRWWMERLGFCPAAVSAPLCLKKKEPRFAS